MFFVAQLVLTTILISVQWYFYRSAARNGVRGHRSMGILVSALFFLGSVPLLLLLLFRPALTELPRWMIVWCIEPLYLWHFTFLLLFILFMAVKAAAFVVGLPLRLLRPSGEAALPRARDLAPRRAFLWQGAVAVTGAVLAGSVYGSIRRNRYERTDLQVAVRNLPEAFRGYRIAFISDIHSSVFMTKEEMQRYVDAVNALQADLIVVGGDFVNSSVEEVYPFAEAFSELKAPHGVFGVLGNHDFYTRQVETVAREVNQCGINLLRSSSHILQKGGGRLVLAGVDDVGTSARAAGLFDAAFLGSPAGVPKILMCHRPYYFQQAADRSVDLVLSGHTHGGQIVFGTLPTGVLAPARVVSRYVAGMYTNGQSQMYVSRGIGTVGVPIRFNCPPEITLFTLVPA
jgi:predicted MPP superfamily phosphohydrolase